MQTSIGQPNAFAAEAFPTTRADSASSPSASSNTSSATVTANDFLQLLVTEMRNQDPTANTDPNAYINQLVQINSLQQLVQINEDLGGGSSASSTSAAAHAANARAATDVAAGSTGQNAGAPGAQTGNLALPDTSAAATRVAQALQFPSATHPDLQPLAPIPARPAAANISTVR